MNHPVLHNVKRRPADMGVNRRLVLVTDTDTNLDSFKARVEELLEIREGNLDSYVDFVHLRIDNRASAKDRKIIEDFHAFRAWLIRFGTADLVVCGYPLAGAFKIPDSVDWLGSWADAGGNHWFHKLPHPHYNAPWWTVPAHRFAAQKFLKSLAPPIAPSHQSGLPWRPMTSRRPSSVLA